MIAGKYNIACQQGSTFDILMILQYPNPEYPADCEDPNVCPEYLNWELSEYRARMTVRKYVNSATSLITLTTENGRIFLDEEPGGLRLFIRAEDTLDITSSGVYDIEIISPNNEIDRVIEGVFTLSQEVTK
jgi:hypothetical protein